MDSEVRIKRIVLKRMERCIVCHRHFEPDDITIISRETDMWTMLVECTDCHARNFVAAVLNDGDPEEAQLALRRLTERAIREVQNPLLPDPSDAQRDIPPAADPVAATDVLDMYEFLKDFNGDFQSLFGHRAL